MKNLNYILRSLLLTFAFCMISFSGNSQNKKLNRQEQKEARRNEMFINYQVLDSLLEGKRFVLEADFLENGHGDRAHVLSSLNFIRVDSLKAVIQTGSIANLGYNEVGGVTAEGSLNGWKLSKNLKNLSYDLKFSVTSNIGNYDVYLKVSSDNFARATVEGLRPGLLIYEGHLQTIYNSRVFKGQTF
jgi:hypothetical protein